VDIISVSYDQGIGYTARVTIEWRGSDPHALVDALRFAWANHIRMAIPTDGLGRGLDSITGYVQDLRVERRTVDASVFGDPNMMLLPTNDYTIVGIFDYDYAP
jgi:hypothetical protein